MNAIDKLSAKVTCVLLVLVCMLPAHANAQFTQQGSKLVGMGAVGSFVQQGSSISLSSDGNTAIVGGVNDSSFLGAIWVYTRSGTGVREEGRGSSRGQV